jgi:hypothetical protein
MVNARAKLPPWLITQLAIAYWAVAVIAGNEISIPPNQHHKQPAGKNAENRVAGPHLSGAERENSSVLT